MPEEESKYDAFISCARKDGSSFAERTVIPEAFKTVTLACPLSA
jgi:hypothetical protein